jgi:hypothetical protein
MAALQLTSEPYFGGNETLLQSYLDRRSPEPWN